MGGAWRTAGTVARRAGEGIVAPAMAKKGRTIDEYLAATTPDLLVPRLTQGMRLPVIVHPDAPERLAIQWHLV